MLQKIMVHFNQYNIVYAVSKYCFKFEYQWNYEGQLFAHSFITDHYRQYIVEW